MTTHQRYVFRIFGSIFLIHAVAVIVAVSVAGWTPRGLEIWHLIIRWLIRAGWLFIIGFFMYSFWFAVAYKKQIELSRAACRRAKQNLYNYLMQNSLNGFSDPECQRLWRELERTLFNHRSRYFADFLMNAEIRDYHRYWKKVQELEAQG